MCVFLLLFPQVNLAFIGMQGVFYGLYVVAQHQLSAVKVKAFGRSIAKLLFREGADYQNFIRFPGHGVHVDLAGMGEMLPVFAVPDAGEGLAQSDGPAVEVQNGVRVCFLGGNLAMSARPTEIAAAVSIPCLRKDFTVDEYIDLVIDFIERLPQRIVLERFVSQSPKSLLIQPDWGLKNHEFTAKIHRRLDERDSYQGRLLSTP